MKKKLLISALLLLAVIVAACAVYVGDYYRADEEAIAVFASEDFVHELKLSETATAYIPENPSVGFVFYPGGKVEHTAYAPLMQACAEHGILCVLIEMPFSLAVMDIDAADGIQEHFPEIEDWYIGGHSLGGSMAASYLADNAENYSGLILLGSYSTTHLSCADVDVLSIYGSEDAVMNREKYAENLCNMPADFSELIIEGGNHAGFGMYGEQEGDGEATISSAEQIEIAADAIAEFVK